MSSQTRLPTPNWDLWQRKDQLSLREAALISMGINPFPRAVEFLKSQRKDRYKEYHIRYIELTRAYGKDPLLPARSSLPKVISLKEALEYSNGRGWLRKTHVRSELEKLRRADQEAIDRASIESSKEPEMKEKTQVKGPPAEALPGSHLPLVQIMSTDMQGRASKNLLKTVGALLVLLEQQDLKKFKLGNGRINQSVVAAVLQEIAAEHSLEANTSAGFSDRLIKQHLSEGRKLYRVTEGKEPGPATDAEGGTFVDDE